MRILNIRRGFACNSSSTHSIIFTDEKLQDFGAHEGDYGWQAFVAASEEAKRKWLGATIRSCLADLDVGEAIAETVARTWAGDIGEYVDHQSQVILPVGWDGKGLDKEFVDDFLTWLLNPRIAVLGGNDNSDAWEDVSRPAGHDAGYRGVLPVDGGVGHLVARKDPGGYWTLFDRKDGSRTRFAFCEGDMNIETHRAGAPELVDLKITGYCTWDCPACYQGSDRKGQHGKFSVIQGILHQLGEMRCFEVAIGGGEPTLNPEFAEIVRHARFCNVVPNITTRDPKWFLREPELLAQLGGFAVSCDSLKEVEALAATLKRLPPELREQIIDKVSVQHVLGLVDEWQLKQIFRGVAGISQAIRVTLLGYKTTGRGDCVTPKTPKAGTWGEWITRFYNDKNEASWRPYGLGVDTVLASEFAGLVPNHLLTTREGQFSAYIDASLDQPKLYPSSFGAHEGTLFDTNVWAHGGGERRVPLEAAWRRLTAYEPQSAYTYKPSLPVLRA